VRVGDWEGPSKIALSLLSFKSGTAYRNINDVLSLNSSMFCDSVDSMYHIRFEIKESTDTAMSASYLEKSLKIHKL